MSFAKQNLEAFINLLKAKPGLFSQEKVINLKEFMSNVPDETEKLSDAIATWYQKHPKILDAQLAALNHSLNSNVSDEIDKSALLNAIKHLGKGKDRNKKNRL